MTDYIYALRCPIANAIRYIGKTKRLTKRFNAHLSSAQNYRYRHHTSAWLRKVLATGQKPTLIVLEEVAEGCDWRPREVHWIAHAKANNWPLTNSTSGGDGVPLDDPELKQKWYDALLASQRRPEVAAARAENMRRRHQDPEYREKVRAALTDPDVIRRKNAAISKAHRARGERIRAAKPYVSPEEREAIKLQNYRAAWTPEKRAMQSKRTAENADRLKAGLTPEVMARRAETLRQTHAKRKAERAESRAAEAAQQLEASLRIAQTWLEQCCILGGFRHIRHELYASYRSKDPTPMRDTEFYAWLVSKGFPAKKSSSRFHLGITLA